MALTLVLTPLLLTPFPDTSQVVDAGVLGPDPSHYAPGILAAAALLDGDEGQGVVPPRKFRPVMVFPMTNPYSLGSTPDE